MSTQFEVVDVPTGSWANCILDVISVRTSAYEQWNGPKSEEEQRREAEVWLAKWSAGRHPALFLARQNNKVIGYLSADERQRGEFYISHIGVREDLKRKGIGRALLRKYEEKARANGYRALTTTTYNRFKGMLLMLLQEGFYIQGTTWVEGATEPRISLRKELK